MAIKKKKTVKSIGSKSPDLEVKLLRDFWENIPDAAYLKDIKGRFILANDAYLRGVGLSHAQVIGKTETDLFSVKNAKKAMKDDEDVLNKGRVIINRIDKGEWYNDARSYVSVTKVPRYDKKGKVVGLLAVMRDVTACVNAGYSDKKSAQQEKRLKMLEGLNRSKSEFIAAISHELRTPLAIIKQLFLLIYDETVGPTTERQTEVLVKIRHNIERLSNMINNLLDISSMERDKVNLRYSLVTLQSLIDESKDFFEEKTKEKNIQIAYVLPREEVSLFVDVQRIGQVITNLLNNALKFTKEGGSIKVEAKMLGADVRVGVIDTGIGIPESETSKIFEKFVQVSHTEEEKKGIGMGLSIVKELVERHGGKIWVESTMGVGTKFYFTLPRFYTAHLTSKQVIDKINRFLDEEISVYVVNLFIINHKRFKDKVKIGAHKLSKDLKALFSETMPAFFPAHQVEQSEFVSDGHHGRYSIIFPDLPQRKINKFCIELQDRIKNYFTDQSIEDAFIVLGVSTLSSKEHIKAAEEGSPSIMVREMYIGPETRRHKRINYNAQIEVVHSSGTREVTEMVDLSQGGLCFESPVQTKIDEIVEVTFDLLKKKKTICAKGRVSWLGRAQDLPGSKGGRMKVGIEFQGLESKDSSVLASELRLYYD